MDTEMHYVYTVWKHKSFSKAAKELYLTQPALSAAVKRVETKLGMPLFDRTGKPLQLTAAGKLYIEKAEQIHQLEVELEAQMSDLHDMNTGIIRIATTSYFTTYVLPPVLLKYMEMYPGVRIELHECSGITAQKMLADGKIDLSFASKRKDTELFTHTPGITDHLLLAVPTRFPMPESVRKMGLLSAQIAAGWHLSEDHPWLSLEHFKSIPFMVVKEGNDMRRRIDALFDKANYIPQINMEGQQFLSTYNMAIHGMGAAFMYDRSILDTGANILYFKLDPSFSIRHINLVSNPKYYTSNALLKFVAMFREYYSTGQV